MQHTYCYICGGKLQEAGDGRWWCTGCQQHYYANPKPCVELAIFDQKGRVLLSQRGRDPDKGKFDLPGGFIDLNETAEEAVLREMNEELGLRSDQLTTPRYLTSYLMDYVWGKEVYKIIVFEFISQLMTGAKIRVGDDVVSTKFVYAHEVDSKELASAEVMVAIKRTSDVMLATAKPSVILKRN